VAFYEWLGDNEDMSTITTLKNQLLVAMPSLTDPNFKHAVAYLFEHSELGSMGIIINKPMDINVGSVLKMLNIPISDQGALDKFPVLRGGPVSREQGFIIHREADIGNGELASKRHHIVISASKEDLITINQNSFDRVIMSLGYAGWGGGQLEDEIVRNDWLVAPLDPSIIFDVPYEQRWKAAAASIGVDFNKLIPDVGHA